MRKPNYSQDRAQRERDKAAKAQAKEQRRRDQKPVEADSPGERLDVGTPMSPRRDDQ